MDARTLKALEWDRVLALLSLCAATEEGKRRAEALLPSAEPEEVELRLGRVAEFTRGEILLGRLALDSYRRGPTQVPPGVALPLTTLRDLRAGFRAWKRSRSWVADPECPTPLLAQLLPSAPSTEEVLLLLERTLDDRGEVADGASPRLMGLRRERERVRGEVFSLMDGLVAKLGGEVLRQESFTVRNGRLVLPVQSSRKGEVKGILHDSSSTGATSYIEPMAAVELNNRLSSLEAEEREEIHRILLEASRQITLRSPELEGALDAVEALDLVAACARFGRAFGGLSPQLDLSGERVRIVAGRHPLLDPRLNGLRGEAWGEVPRGEVVPLNLEMALGGMRTLVVSGPNAGGKSVALKTAGLLCAMNQAGIPVGVEEGSVFPVFRFLYAAVGDSQSILDSLSTFSARMVHLKEALEHLEEPFLAILDELGAGTDPAEGAALGEAILLHLHERRGFTLCSTHQEALKARALVTEGMGNACMEFSEGDARPTFQLHQGRVGASRALDAATRAGLPASLLQRARELLPREEKRLKEVLEALEAEGEALEVERERLKERQETLLAEKKRLEEAVARVEAERMRFAEGIPERLRRAEEQFLASLKSEVNRQAVRKVARKEAPKAAEAAAKSAGLTAPEAAVARAVPKVGDRVRLAGIGLEGVVLRAETTTGKVTVDCAGKTLQVGVADIAPVAPGAPSLSPRRVGAGAELRSREASLEINLIGKTVAEAVEELDSFLDRAAVAGMTFVRVIHGIGTGRLRQGVHAHLKASPYVASFEEAPPSQGGTGATLVSLKN